MGSPWTSQQAIAARDGIRLSNDPAHGRYYAIDPAWFRPAQPADVWGNALDAAHPLATGLFHWLGGTPKNPAPSNRIGENGNTNYTLPIGIDLPTNLSTRGWPDFDAKITPLYGGGDTIFLHPDISYDDRFLQLTVAQIIPLAGGIRYIGAFSAPRGKPPESTTGVWRITSSLPRTALRLPAGDLDLDHLPYTTGGASELLATDSGQLHRLTWPEARNHIVGPPGRAATLGNATRINPTNDQAAGTISFDGSLLVVRCATPANTEDLAAYASQGIRLAWGAATVELTSTPQWAGDTLSANYTLTAGQLAAVANTMALGLPGTVLRWPDVETNNTAAGTDNKLATTAYVHASGPSLPTTTTIVDVSTTKTKLVNLGLAANLTKDVEVLCQERGGNRLHGRWVGKPANIGTPVVGPDYPYYSAALWIPLTGKSDGRRINLYLALTSATEYALYVDRAGPMSQFNDVSFRYRKFY